GKMEILTGIEWDSLSDEPVPEGLDYWIGSVHNLRSSETGKYYSVDWRRDSFCACRDEVYGGDIYAMIDGYYAEVARLAAKKPTI
ncbi:MAG: histidinol phosphate phosphatase, partial [Clostridia bacterium]|nr:histidinol phosphate phosphatase [Clostridia bacterium]